MPRAGAALGDVLHLAPWLTKEWFLIVPLLLNAFVLCPIIIRRALRARRADRSARHAGDITVSLSVASTVAGLILLYLLLVFLHDR
jgi:hypothetical protein